MCIVCMLVLVLLVRLELNGLTQSRIYPHNTFVDTHNHCLNSLSKSCLDGSVQ